MLSVQALTRYVPGAQLEIEMCRKAIQSYKTYDLFGTICCITGLFYSIPEALYWTGGGLALFHIGKNEKKEASLHGKKVIYIYNKSRR